MQISMKACYKWYHDFDRDDQAFPKFPEQQICNVFTISQKKVRDEVDFLHADKHPNFVQVNFNILGIKVSYKMMLSLLMGRFKHSQSTQSNKFAISLQYLKKEVRNEVHIFHADKHQSFHKLALSFLIEVARNVQSTQNRKLVIFLQYVKKKVSHLLLCSILMQNIQIL